MPFYMPAYLYEEPKYKEICSNSENLNLLLSRFICFDNQENPPKISKDWTTKKAERIDSNSRLFNTLCNQRADEHLMLLANCHLQGESVRCFDMSTDGYFLPGLGTSHINENGLSLDYIHGLPQLPGSSVKGVARAWFIDLLACDMDVNLNCVEKLLEAENLEELLALSNKENARQQLVRATAYDAYRLPEELLNLVLENSEYRDLLLNGRAIFGTQENAGRVVFFDSQPLSFKIIADIMTPHYGSYYNGSGAPLDNDTPKPISFFAVSEARFRFTLMTRDDNLLMLASSWLRQGLEKLGAGAKTAVGYGYFTEYEEIQNELILNKSEELRIEKITAAMSPLERFHYELEKDEDNGFVGLCYGWFKGDFGDRDEESDSEVIDIYYDYFFSLDHQDVTTGLLDLVIHKLMKLIPNDEQRIERARRLLEHEALSMPEFGNYVNVLRSHLPRETSSAPGDDTLIEIIRSGNAKKIAAQLGRAVKLLENQSGQDETFQLKLAKVVLTIQPNKAIKNKLLKKARKAAANIIS